MHETCVTLGNCIRCTCKTAKYVKAVDPGMPRYTDLVGAVHLRQLKKKTPRNMLCSYTMVFF